MNKVVIFIYIIIFIITSFVRKQRGLGFEKVKPDDF